MYEFLHSQGQTRPSSAIDAMSPLPPIASVMPQRRKRQKRASKRHHAIHSITSSARASSVGGTSRPSALAVFRRRALVANEVAS
jgi:hypothetical protein